jgi:hypothetical protein
MRGGKEHIHDLSLFNFRLDPIPYARAARTLWHPAKQPQRAKLADSVAGWRRLARTVPATGLLTLTVATSSHGARDRGAYYLDIAQTSTADARHWPVAPW